MSLILSLLVATAHAVTLDDAFQSALKKNEVVGQAQENVVQAEEQITQAVSAIYPSLFFSSVYQFQEMPSNPIAREFTPQDQTTMALTLNQPLFRGFREFAARRQRKYMLSAEQQNRISTLTALYKNVATGYLNVLALEQDLRNLKEQRSLHGQRVKELAGRARTGQSQATEVLTAQAQEAALDGEIVLIETNLRTARERLALMTGLAADTKLEDSDVKAGENIQVRALDQYINRMEKRPDIRGAMERLRAAEEEVSIARGGHWPSADLVGNYYFVRPGFLSDIRWDVQAKLTFPIFEGGLRNSETRQKSSQLREAELEVARLRREAATEIRTLHESLSLRMNHLAALKRASDLTEKNYLLLLREARRGLTRNIEVQMALTDFRASRRNYDQARYQARLDLISLDTAASILPASITKDE